MIGIGSGDNGEITFLDAIAIVSFFVGLQNLDLNISQSDLDTQTQELDRRLRGVVDEIHQHLQDQDEKINTIIEVLRNDTYKGTSRSDQG